MKMEKKIFLNSTNFKYQEEVILATVYIENNSMLKF